MKELLSILLIGISLSMDTFSLSLTMGTLNNAKNNILIAIIVGIFHFFMPLLGNILGLYIISTFNIKTHLFLGLILILLGIKLLIDYFKNEEVNFNLSLIGIIIFAFSVSIDAFTIGLGISNLEFNTIYASIIFAICSFSFTYLGLIIGKYSKKYLGKYATILGIILLFILGIYYLFNN